MHSKDDELLFQENDKLLFAAELPGQSGSTSPEPWKIMIVDDEEEVHQVTHMVLDNFTFEDASVNFISAYSGGEAKNLLARHPDTALILLDVVMESDQAGLEVARYIRNELKNRFIRIILRTGQPGHAPERQVIVDYDINDYKSKSELTSQKLFTTVTAGLRSFRDIHTIEKSRQRLEKIITALNVAQEVQQCLLPSQPPKVDRIDIAGKSLYCDETGGDYFDFIGLPGHGDGSFCIAVGDVSGHGISAALLMAGARAYLRARSMQPGSISEIISDVNALLSFDTMKTCQFMTLFFLVVEPYSRKLAWVRAGHEPALLYSPWSDTFEELGGTGIALGLSEDWKYTCNKGVARHGQILLIATDGIWETRNEDGEFFGKQRLKEIIRSNAHLDAENIERSVLDAVAIFQEKTLQDDDITLVLLKFL